MPLESFTRATLRSAEFGFFGVVVFTRVHAPRRCGLPLRAGVLDEADLVDLPLRTSCWIVGTGSPCLSCTARMVGPAGAGHGGAVAAARTPTAAPRAFPPAPTPALGRVVPLEGGLARRQVSTGRGRAGREHPAPVPAASRA